MAEEVLHDGLNTYLDREMGCLKLPYQGEGAGNYPPLKICRDLEEKEDTLKKCDDYYPFGLTFNSSERSGFTSNMNLYQGKEWQRDLGLDTYDFHARMYDPMVGKTFQLDPHLENYYEWSPYSWTGDNPINMIDPDGMDWYKDEDGNEIQIIGVTGQVDGYTWVKNDNTAYALDEIVIEDTYTGPDVSESPMVKKAQETKLAGENPPSSGALEEVYPIYEVLETVSGAKIGKTIAKKTVKEALGAMSSTSGDNKPAQLGRKKHKELSKKVNEKGGGWQSEPRMVGKDGKTYIPDVVTPGGFILEYKPFTKRGMRRGKSQIKKYEKQLGRKGRVIYYKVE